MQKILTGRGNCFVISLVIRTVCCLALATALHSVNVVSISPHRHCFMFFSKVRHRPHISISFRIETSVYHFLFFFSRTLPLNFSVLMSDIPVTDITFVSIQFVVRSRKYGVHSKIACIDKEYDIAD